MHFRVRRSEKCPLKYDIFVVGVNKKEQEADPKIQRLWDFEQLRIEKEMQRKPLSLNRDTLFYMKSPKTVFLSDFIVEFLDLNCKYLFFVSGGVGQWLYEPVPGEEGLQENGLEAGAVSTRHEFFCEALVPVTAQMHNNLMCLLLNGSTIISNWVLCHQPYSHNHQLVNIYLDSDDCGREIHQESKTYHCSKIGYTTHVVCWNARLVDFFDALCGDTTYKKDELSLTHILPGRTYGKVDEMVRVGNPYPYHKARVEQTLMEDLGWRVHGDDRIWVMPS